MTLFLAQMGALEIAFWGCAIIGTMVFILKMALLMLGFGGAAGGDVDMDVDLNGDGVFDAAEAADAASLKLFTLQSIMALLMGFGWIGLAMRYSYPVLNDLIHIAVALASGVVLAFLLALIMKQVLKLNSEFHYDIRTTVGRNGKVYMSIPEKGDGFGQIEINVQGRRQMVQAVSSAGKIDAFKEVKVVDMDSPNVVVVEPVM